VLVSDESLWSEYFKLIPTAPGETHLNAGTLSPTPNPIFDRQTQLRVEQATVPSTFFFKRSAQLLAVARSALAQYLNCQTPDLFLLPNVTVAMNLVMQSLRFSPGDEILTSDHEYGAMRILLDYVAARDGAIVKVIELPYRAESFDEHVAAFEVGFTTRTKAIFFCHVTSASALVLPAARLCRLARSRGVLSLIDGAHAPGLINVDLQEINADAYGANCHKWMMAPAGAGFLHVSDLIKPHLQPLIRTWGDGGYDPARSDQIISDDEWAMMPRSTRLQYRIEYIGVADRTAQLVLPETIALLKQIGQARIASRVADLAEYARVAVSNAGLNCASPANPELRCGMTIFDLPYGVDVASTRRQLWLEHKIMCPITQVAGQNFLRVSTAWFNRRCEIDLLACAVRSIFG